MHVCYAIVAWCTYPLHTGPYIHSLDTCTLHIPASRCVHYITVHSRTCTKPSPVCFCFCFCFRLYQTADRRWKNCPDMSVISINRASAAATRLPQPHTTHYTLHTYHTRVHPPLLPKRLRAYLPTPFHTTRPSSLVSSPSPWLIPPALRIVRPTVRVVLVSAMSVPCRARANKSLCRSHSLLAPCPTCAPLPPVATRSQAAYWPAALGGVQHNLLLACQLSP